MFIWLEMQNENIFWNVYKNFEQRFENLYIVQNT